MSQKILGQIIGLALTGNLPRIEGIYKHDFCTLAEMFKITQKEAEYAVSLANGGIDQFFKVKQ